MNTTRYNEPSLEIPKHDIPGTSIIFPIESPLLSYCCSTYYLCFHSMPLLSGHSKRHGRIQQFFKLWVSFWKSVSYDVFHCYSSWEKILYYQNSMICDEWAIFWGKKTVNRDISTYLVLNENTNSTCVQLIQLVIKTTC